jgi:hypothetical protein
MTTKPHCPNCSRSLPGGRFNACPACGYDLRSGALTAPFSSATATAGQQQAPPKANPQVFGASSGGATPPKPISSSASSILFARAKKCRFLLLAFLACLALTNFVPSLWTFWYASRLRELVAQHGLGNVPQHHLDAVNNDDWLNIASLLGAFVAAILLLMLIYQSTKVLRDIGIPGLKWSPGWTMGSVLIPFLFLYRPWVGLNELDRTLTGMLDPSSGGRLPPAIARRDFGLPTLIYAILFFLSLIANKVFGAVEKQLENKNIPDQLAFYHYVDSWEKYIIALLLFVVIMIFTHSIYWNKIFNKMEEVSRKINTP